MSSQERYVTRKGFATLCRPHKPLTLSTVQTAIKGKKIFEERDEDGHYIIDTENEINKAYLARWHNKIKTDLGKQVADADIQKKTLEVEIREQDLILKKIQIAKMNGEVIPTNLAGNIIQSNNKQMQLELKYSLERYVADLVKKMGGSKVEVAKARGQVVDVINEATIKARQGMQSNLRTIVNEYQKTK